MRRCLGVLLLWGIWQTAFCQQSRIEAIFSVRPDGHPMVMVRNNYRSPITGFVMTVNPGGATPGINDEVRSYHDVYIHHHHDRKIRQGESYTIPVPYIVGTDVNTLKPHFMAVVFEDGSVWGDDHWASKIASMRKRLLEEIGVLQGMIDISIQMNLSGDTLLARIESERSARSAQDETAELEISLIDNLALDNLAEGLRSASPTSQTSLQTNSFTRLAARFEEWRQALSSGSLPIAQSTSSTGLEMLAGSRVSAFPRRGTLIPVSLRSTLEFPLAMMQADSCTVTETSFIVPAVDNPNNCGTAIWELVATASDGARLDVGQTTAFGQCYGNYTDCQDTFHAPKNTGIAGIKLAQFSFIDGNTPAVKFGWSIDNWQAASYQACSCNDPDPDGETETPPTKAAILSPFWIHDCH